MSPKYPDDAIQSLASSWGVEDRAETIVRGRLIWTLIPYPEMNAALPIREGETYLVGRGKRRPAIVISTGGGPIPKDVRGGPSRWQSAQTILVAPYYGADPSAARGGWPAPFVERIRRAEYPQYIWDILPIGRSEIESILRLDHIMPVGADSANWRIEPYVLSEEARALFDQWLSWLVTGNLSDASALGYARAELAKL